MQWMLVPFGWCFIVMAALAVIIPYARGRRDLINFWTLFLLGSASFVGFAAVQAGNSGTLQFRFEDMDYVKFVTGAILFYVVLFFAYFRLKFPRRMAARRLTKWPPPARVLPILMPVCLILSLLSLLSLRVPTLSVLLLAMGQNALLLLMAYLLVHWLKRPYLPWTTALMAMVVLYALVFALLGGSGRRPLLNVAITCFICLYWLYLRYMPASRTLLIAAAGAGLTAVLLLGYSTIRHRNKEEVRETSYAVESLKMLPSAVLGLTGTHDVLLGGDAVENSLIAINRFGYSIQKEPPRPFFSVWMILGNPIPRVFWESKPVTLGTSLPRDVGAWHTGYVNWGPGIIGHCFHEGGYHIVVFYALVLGAFFRFFDDVLERQPDNPYLLAIFGGASSNIVAFSRGDIVVFSVAIIGTFVTILLVCRLLRAIYGTWRYTADQKVEPESQTVSYDQGLGYGAY